jgi:EAL and modified HD-GYP domain-containing signal transduction protein
MNRSLFDILSEIPLEIEIVQAILGFDNDLSKGFRIVLAYEKGDWNKVNKMCLDKKIDSKKIRDAYMKSLEWVNNIYRS